MISYRDAGVSISAADKLVNILKSRCGNAYDSDVISGIGGFCSLQFIPNSSLILASSTDGVGTKLILSQQMKEFGGLKTIGIDLVAMVVNDIITCGALPISFLDYYAVRNLEMDEKEDFDSSLQILDGIIDGCNQAGCPLVGGETSEMNDVFQENLFDIVGFGTGLVNEKYLLPNEETMEYGDVLIGLESSGPHSNGYTLIRKLFSYDELKNNEKIRNALLAPTIIYVPYIRDILKKKSLVAIAHITGGGLSNISRVLPLGVIPDYDLSRIDRPFIFDMIQERSELSNMEMEKTFNCGVGMVLVVKKKSVSYYLKYFEKLGLKSFVIGTVE